MKVLHEAEEAQMSFESNQTIINELVFACFWIWSCTHWIGQGCMEKEKAQE